MSNIVPEFQLTHIALVGARMSLFKPYGYTERNQLAMRRVVPDMRGKSLVTMSGQERLRTFRSQLPIWVHNIITDPDFPARTALLMPLRRFEGELYDSKSNDVVASVLSAGFKNQTLDPLNLPDSMPLRQRCAVVTHIDAWQAAYRRLEHELVTILAEHAADLDTWMVHASQPEYAAIELDW